MTREGERVRVRHFTGRIEVMMSGIFPMGRDRLDGSHFYVEMPPPFSSFMLVAFKGIMLFISILMQESSAAFFQLFRCKRPYRTNTIRYRFSPGIRE
jgi:hypothetical protein